MTKYQVPEVWQDDPKYVTPVTQRRLREVKSEAGGDLNDKGKPYDTAEDGTACQHFEGCGSIGLGSKATVLGSGGVGGRSHAPAFRVDVEAVSHGPPK